MATLLLFIVIIAVCFNVNRRASRAIVNKAPRVEMKQAGPKSFTPGRSLSTTIPPIAAPKRPMNPKQPIAQQVNMAYRGDVEAQRDLMTIAEDDRYSVSDREIAIRYLGKKGDPDSLAIVAQQLISPEPGIRTTAFYSLPSKFQPEGYDYTAAPTDISTGVVAKLVARIRQ